MPEKNTIEEGNKSIVVHVIDNYNVAINKKPIEDIQVGDRFIIFELSEEITDPSNNESLGRLKLYKGTGRVEDVQDTMAIVKSDRESLQSVILRTIYMGGEKPLMQFNNAKKGDLAERISRTHQPSEIE
jgi:hypothetical protein